MTRPRASRMRARNSSPRATRTLTGSVGLSAAPVHVDADRNAPSGYRDCCPKIGIRCAGQIHHFRRVTGSDPNRASNWSNPPLLSSELESVQPADKRARRGPSRADHDVRHAQRRNGDRPLYRSAGQPKGAVRSRGSQCCVIAQEASMPLDAMAIASRARGPSARGPSRRRCRPPSPGTSCHPSRA